MNKEEFEKALESLDIYNSIFNINLVKESLSYYLYIWDNYSFVLDENGVLRISKEKSLRENLRKIHENIFSYPYMSYLNIKDELYYVPLIKKFKVTNDEEFKHYLQVTRRYVSNNRLNEREKFKNPECNIKNVLDEILIDNDDITYIYDYLKTSVNMDEELRQKLNDFDKDVLSFILNQNILDKHDLSINHDEINHKYNISMFDKEESNVMTFNLSLETLNLSKIIDFDDRYITISHKYISNFFDKPRKNFKLRTNNEEVIVTYGSVEKETNRIYNLDDDYENLIDILNLVSNKESIEKVKELELK